MARDRSHVTQLKRSNTALIVLVAILATLVVLGLLAFFGIEYGMMPANADAKPPSWERWAARTSLRATLSRVTQGLQNPVQPNTQNLTAGVHLYAKNCVVCHGAADGKASTVALGLYQRPPQFAKDDVTDDPVAVTYWKIDHGIRFTGMPAFDNTLTQTEIWQMATFLKHQNELPPAAKTAWEAIPSVGAPNGKGMQAPQH